MKQIKRVYIIIILIIICRCVLRNICIEESRQTASKDNDYALKSFEEELNVTSVSEIDMKEYEDINELTERLEAFIKPSLQPDETPICFYEGMNKFAVYKKTLEKDIVFVNVVLVEKETNRIFTWNEDEMIIIGSLEDKKEGFSEKQNSDNDYHILLKEMEGDELLDRVMSKLAQNGSNHLNLIYDGTINFLNRDYYMISSFDSFEDHIIRNQEYYVDSTNGDIYCVGENSDSLRTELFYIDNLQLNSVPP